MDGAIVHALDGGGIEQGDTAQAVGDDDGVMCSLGQLAILGLGGDQLAILGLDRLGGSGLRLGEPPTGLFQGLSFRDIPDHGEHGATILEKDRRRIDLDGERPAVLRFVSALERHVTAFELTL